MEFLYKCRTLSIPLLLVMILSFPIYTRYGFNSAYFFNLIGSLLVGICNIVYIVFWYTSDSRLPWERKLVNLLSFKSLYKP